MKAYDAFLDRQSRDIGLDRSSSRLLSLEVDTTMRTTMRAQIGDASGSRKDTSVQVEGKRSERIAGPNLLSKAHNDVGKLVKQKMALQGHLEKLSQEQDYAMHCRVAAQLDLLDKALKKLGA